MTKIPTATNTVKFFYLPDPKHPDRVITVARRVNDKGTKMQVGVATYHYDGLDRTPFTKEIGRNIATGRLDKDPLKIRLGSDTPLRTAVRAVADATDREDMVCQTTRRLAKDWLATDALRTQAFSPALSKGKGEYHPGPFTAASADSDRKAYFDDHDLGMEIDEIDEHNNADAHEDMADRRRKDSSG